MAQTTEYGGPAILSRGEMPSLNAPASISFRPFIGISGIYDTSLFPVAVTSTGQVPFTDGYGEELNYGLSGSQVWQRTTLSLDFRGDLRHYSPQSYYDSSDDFLALTLTNTPARHLKFTLRSQAGTYSQNSFLPNYEYLYPTYLQTPQNDIYDNRVIFGSAAGDLTYQKSARLSFNIGGEGDLVRRRSTALYGVTEAAARGDVQYRITRHSTIGADYHYMHFDFTRGFGYSNIQSVGVDYSTQFTRQLQLSAHIGGARVTGLNLVDIPIDPAIAAIIGQTFGVQTAHPLQYAPDIMARLTYSQRHSTFSVGYLNTVSPGNGIYLTSKMQSGTGSYSYTGIRNWNFGLDSYYSRLDALVQTLGAYDSYGGGMGVTRTLGKGLHAVMRFDALRYQIANNFFAHNEYRVSVGLNWSPGEVPLALW